MRGNGYISYNQDGGGAYSTSPVLIVTQTLHTTCYQVVITFEHAGTGVTNA